MRSYDEIKNELVTIGEVLKKYPDNIQPQVFDILINSFLGSPAIEKTSDQIKLAPSSTENKTKKNTKQKNPKNNPKNSDSLVILKDLDLRVKGQKSFKEFYEEKNPKSASEFNTVAVFYLAEILQLSGITPNHIYTCYKEVTKRPPEAFIQSLRDTANKNGYIDTSNITDIKIPLRGKNFVDHDLPKQKIKK